MDKQDDILIDEQNLQQSDSAQTSINIPKLTIQTFFCVFVVGVLLLYSFLSFFPYNAMKFYTSFDLKSRALYSSEVYLRQNNKYSTASMPKGDSKYADALLLSVNNSISLMDAPYKKLGANNSRTLTLAKSVDKHVEEFLQYNSAGSMADRAKAINEYNILHTSPSMHATLYDYANHISVMQYKAQNICGQYKELYSQHLSDTSDWGEDNWKITDKNANDIFLMFDKLNTYISMQLKTLGYGKILPDKAGIITDAEIKKAIVFSYDKPFTLFIDPNFVIQDETASNGDIFTQLYKNIEENFAEIIEYIVSNAMSKDNASAKLLLPYTYYLKVMSEFANNMIIVGRVVNVNARFYADDCAESIATLKTRWNSLNWVNNVKIKKDGKETSAGTLEDWYKYGLSYAYQLMFR